MNKRTLLFTLLALAVVGTAHASLITNGSFEIVPNADTGQGILPTDWVNIPPPTPTADTYSIDGSYGLTPGSFGNFPGVSAHDGIRWVAGWSEFGQESFGQFLTGPVVAGTEYQISGWLHQAVRADLDNPGGYEVYLTDTPGVQTEFLGFLGSTTSVAAGWEFFSFTFSATPAMTALDFVEFGPAATGGGGAYPGLDLVSFDVTDPGKAPEPMTWTLILLGLTGLKLRRSV